jgi:methyltransferase
LNARARRAFEVLVATAGPEIAGTSSARPIKRARWAMLGVVLLAQGLRWWCIATLGRQWNTRVVVVPGASRVTGGPYRIVPHPNYVAVVAEGVALPLVQTGWITALVFSVLNAALLRTRIRVENAALSSLT